MSKASEILKVVGEVKDDTKKDENNSDKQFSNASAEAKSRLAKDGHNNFLFTLRSVSKEFGVAEEELLKWYKSTYKEGKEVI